MAYWRNFSWRHPNHLRGPARREYLLVQVGGALLAVSTILPWVTIAGFGGVDLFKLHDVERVSGFLPISMAAVGAALFFAAYLGARIRWVAWASIATVAGVVAGGGGDWVHLYRLVHGTGGFMSFGYGILVAAAGLVCLTMAFARVRGEGPEAPAQRARARRRRNLRVVAEAPPDRSPGWKLDPWGVGGTRRYWDGQAWTSQTSYNPF